jgi:hypothetical protein
MALPRILTVDSNNSVVLDEVILSVPEFRIMWEHCQDLLPFQYIWGLFDPESPYLNFDEMDREEIVLKDFPIQGYLNDLEMINLINKAEKMYNSPERKILKGTKTAIEKLVQYFETMEIESGRDGNLSGVKASIVDMAKMIQSYKQVEQTYKQEVEKNRGGLASAIDDNYDSNYND